MQGGSGPGASSLCLCLGPVCTAVSAPPLIRHVERFRLPGSLCGRVARLRPGVTVAASAGRSPCGGHGLASRAGSQI